MPVPDKAAAGRHALALYAIAIAVGLLIASSTTTYWDAFGYLTQAVTGTIGGLGAGRPVFVLAAHGVARLWLGLGGSPWALEPVLRASVLLVTAASAPLTWTLARACDLDARVAWTAGLVVAVSPALAHTGTQMLTDGPAVTCVVLSCLWGVRAARRTPRLADAALSGAALIVAAGVREQSIASAATLALLAWIAPRPHRVRVALAMAAGAAAVVLPLLALWMAQPGHSAMVRGWLAGMREDRALKTYGWRDALVYGGWLLSLGPVATIAAVRALTERPSAIWHPRRVLFAVTAPAVAQVCWMATLRGIGYSPRFLLASLPAAIAIPGAVVLARWVRHSRAGATLVVVALGLPVVIAAPVLRWYERPLEAVLRPWPAMIRRLPLDATIVSGQPCPAVPYVQALVMLDRTVPAPRWDPVCPGWAWPSDLPATLDASLDAGRTVAVDLRSASWIGDEQRAAMHDAARYVAARPQAIARGAVVVWR